MVQQIQNLEEKTERIDDAYCIAFYFVPHASFSHS